jgi:hemolysin-activating ACP:hemolysin acyltransferase
MLSTSDRLAILIAFTADGESQSRRQSVLSEHLTTLSHSFDRWVGRVNFDHFGRQLMDSGKRVDPTVIKPEYVDKLRRLLREQLKIGNFLIGLGVSKAYSACSLGAALELARTVNTSSQFKTYSDSSGNPAGALTWAWVEECRADAAIATSDLQLHPSEWNEGRCLWFRDVAVAAGSAQEMARDLGGRLFPDSPDCLVTMRSRASGQTVAMRFSGAERASLHDWVARQARLSAIGVEGRD